MKLSNDSNLNRERKKGRMAHDKNIVTANFFAFSKQE